MEARFEPNSYGFRPGRSTHDAIEQVFNRLGVGNDKWILDADIKGAFDNINHEYLLNVIGKKPGIELVKQWLKAGYLEMGTFYQTQSGTPQGGTISPLLANIALEGMEEFLKQFQLVERRYYAHKSRNEKRGRYGYVRYADDFIITAKSREDIEAIKPIIELWLKVRGLELNQEKTQIVNVEDGFNFLGFNIRQYKGKCLIKPQKEKIKAKLREIREWLKKNQHASPEAVIRYLNPIIRGWGNYYRFAVSKKVFSYIDHMVWKALYKWALKRHPKKGKKWVAKKYFGLLKGLGWKFTTTTKNRHGKDETLTIVRLAEIPIQRHVKVKGTASPDDPTLQKYWHSRATRNGKTRWEKGFKLHKIAENQNWICPICGEHLFNGNELDTHHKVRVKDGGTNEIGNLVHLHKTCHLTIHSGKRPEKHEA